MSKLEASQAGQKSGGWFYRGLSWYLLIFLAGGWFAPIGRAQSVQPVNLISVLVLYTPAAEVGAGGAQAIRRQIDTAVVEANTVFQNSRVNARIYLAKTARIDYAESGSVSNDLARLRNPQDTVFSQAHRLRDQYAADLVCLITETGSDWDFYGLQGPSAENAYSILRQPYLTGLDYLPVVLSFNFGCQLEPIYADSAGAFPYAYGYSFYDNNDATEYSTVEAFSGVRLPFFSNPDLQFDGLAAGVPAGMPNPADNALVLNQTAPLVAAFRGSADKVRPPAISITYPATGDVFYSGTNLHLAVTTAAADGDMVKVAWYFDDTNEIASVETAPFSAHWRNLPIGEHTLTAVATDSQQATTVSAPVSITVRPGNDNFADRWNIASLPATISEPNDLATAEPGEPDNNGNPPVHSLWWTWTAPTNTYVAFTLSTNSIPVNISVYTGMTLTNLTVVVADSDYLADGNPYFFFRAIAGTAYQLTADNFESPGEVGFSLTPVPGPANDDFANRTRLTGSSVTVNADNHYATHEPGEPDNAGIPGDASLWWTWTAPADGQLTLTSVSQSGTMPVGFYTGNVLTNLTPVASETPGDQVFYGPGNRLAFAVQAGVAYQFAFDNYFGYLFGYASVTGPFAFNLDFVGVPPNDDFTHRTVISGSWISLTNNNLLATLEPGEPGDGSGNPSIWWSWTAPASGWATVSSTTGDDMLVYTGNSLTNLNPVTLDATGTFYATKGTAYAIAAYGPPGEAALNLALSTVRITSPGNAAVYYLGGTIPLKASTTRNDGDTLKVQYFANGQPVGMSDRGIPFRVNWVPTVAGTYSLTATATDRLGHQRSSPPVTIAVQYPPPANDNFANRAPLNGTWFDANFSNLGATSEPGEPSLGGGYTNSIWWRWTAPVSGRVTLVSPEVFLGVFTGDRLTNLVMVTNSYYTATFAATAGTTYDIGTVGPPGRLELKLSLSNLRMSTPTNGQVFGDGSTLTLQAMPTITEEPVQKIQYYANDNYLGSVSNAPFAFSWTNVPGGDYQLWAIAYDELGQDRSSPAVNISLHPVNDSFANRTTLAGAYVLVTNATANASIGPGSPPYLTGQHIGITWFQWVAPSSGWVTLSVPNANYYYDAFLGVYTGDSLTNLRTIVEGYATTEFVAMAGTTYDIGVAVEISPVVLQLMLSPVQITSPTNGEVVTAGTNLILTVDASSVQNPVSEVDFYTNNVLLGVATSPPYSLPWTNVGGGNFTLTALAVDNQGLSWSVPPVTINAVPVNDDFANRTTLTGTSFNVPGSVAGASWETGEPGLIHDGQDETVWYTWTAPADDVYYFNLDVHWLGQMAVYTGTTLTNLTLVAEEADFSGYPVQITAAAGTTYQIQVNSLYNLNFTLDLLAVPLNDNFAAAFTILGTNVTATGDNTQATTERGEPRSYHGLGHSVWYAWTAPAAGWVTLTLGTNDAWLSCAVYTGNSVSNLTSVANLAPGPGFFPVMPKTTYWIAVEDGPGPFSLNLNFAPAPSNDFFANRTPLSGMSLTVTGSTLFATSEAGEPNLMELVLGGAYTPGQAGNPSVWYAWTAPADGWVSIQTPQAFLGVFTGDVVTNLTNLAAGSIGKVISFAATAGQTYPIMVEQAPEPHNPFTWSLQVAKVAITNPLNGVILPAGTNVEVDVSTIDLEGAVTSVAFYANTNLLGTTTNRPFSLVVSNIPAGDYVLTAQATDAVGGVTTSKPVEFRVAPGNDNFAQRIVFTGTNFAFSGDNSGATTEPGEYLPAGATGRTLWWSWTAPANGNVTLTTSNISGFQSSFYPGNPMPFPLSAGIIPEDVIIINPGFPPAPGPATGPLLAIYTGSSLTNLSLSASNTVYYYGVGPITIGPNGPVFPDYWCVVSPFSFSVTEGQTYQLSLDGVNGSYGAAAVNFAFTPSPPPPPNDNFAQRTILTGGNITTNGTTVEATLELTDPDLGGGLDARTVWYSWTAPASGTVALTVDGPFEPGVFTEYPTFPPYGVFAGSSPGSLIPVATGDAIGNANFYALAGTAYQIEVATPSHSEVTFTLTLTAPAPPTLSPDPPVRLANGSYDLHIIGSVGQSFVIQSSRNGQTWTTLDVDTLVASSLDYIDTKAIGHAARMYRVLSLDAWLNNQPFKMLAPSAGPGNGFSLNFTGVSGQPLLVQSSTNLVDWFNLTSGVLIDNAFNFIDYDAPNYPQRFYRGVPQ